MDTPKPPKPPTLGASEGLEKFSSVEIGSNGYAIPKFITDIPLTSDEINSIVPAQVYGKLALEIATGFYSLPQIAQRYNIRLEVLQAIIDTPRFRVELAEADKKVNKSEAGGFQSRMALIAEDAVKVLSNIMLNDAISPKERMRAVQLATELAGLIPEKKSQVNNSAVVNFVIGEGIRGISDAAGNAGSVVIDGQTID